MEQTHQMRQEACPSCPAHQWQCNSSLQWVLLIFGPLCLCTWEAFCRGVCIKVQGCTECSARTSRSYYYLVVRECHAWSCPYCAAMQICLSLFIWCVRRMWAIPSKSLHHPGCLWIDCHKELNTWSNWFPLPYTSELTCSQADLHAWWKKNLHWDSQ